MRFQFKIEREDDGRWIAEILEVPGAMAYGDTEEQAKAKAYALALYAVADDVERSNDIPDSLEPVAQRQSKHSFSRASATRLASSLPKRFPR